MKKQKSLREAAINQLPSSMMPFISADLPSESLSFFNAGTIHQMQRASGLEQAELGLLLLPLAASFAVTPVSQFNVGAVAFDSRGNAYLGANFEFSDNHIGQTIHAEQSAIAHAWQRGASDLALLVINYPPCGHCRQFINEVKLAENFLIQLPDSPAKPLAHYLPDAFGPSDLGMTQRILGSAAINVDEFDDCESLARKAHAKSHAPYSNSNSGIALRYSDGEIVTGSYAENAAFNPTLPALQMALNTRRLQGKDWKSIERGVMVESSSNLQQRENTESLLRAIGDIQFSYQRI